MDLKYERLRVIGKGSFGKAYLVKNIEVDKLAVVKQMETGAMDAKERNEAVREAMLLKRMVHPNIIQFQEVFMTKKGKLCIVMEYADGGDIHSQIKEAKGVLLPEERIVEWFVQTCFALMFVHDRRVLHRDLKTQNVFLMASGQVKLGDFGIARVLEATKDYAKTMVGTPYYLSPEIIQDRPYAYKSDVWSMGVVLYEMATLKHPFDADCLVNLAAKILKDDIPPIDNKYSSNFMFLTQSMLRKNDKERPTIREILQFAFLSKPMHTCNEKYSLGLDLSEFGEEPTEKAEKDEAADVEDPAEASGKYEETFEDYSGDEGDGASEAPTQPLLALTRSAADLRLAGPAGSEESGGTTFGSKAAALKAYLVEQVGAEHFDKVQSLVRPSGDAEAESSAKSLRLQVAEVLGSERSTVLLPMFQLLCFLEDISASMSESEEADHSPAVVDSKDTIIQTFRKWDINGDKFISRDELQKVFSSLGMTDEEVEKVFKSADANKDGKIDYTEFVSWLYSSSAPEVIGKRVAPLTIV
mmetsp:Transcript_139678/g.260484  ORF Transcript_139678/g.260484 Transcript_139678/m.260484 type:complete len:527 (-) Transcript_139678:10-1590(-)